MSSLTDVARMLAHTPYLSAALAFTLAVLAIDAFACSRAANTGDDHETDEPRHEPQP